MSGSRGGLTTTASEAFTFVFRWSGPNIRHSPTLLDLERCGSYNVLSASAWRERGGIVVPEKPHILSATSSRRGELLPRQAPRTGYRSHTSDGR